MWPGENNLWLLCLTRPFTWDLKIHLDSIQTQWFWNVLRNTGFSSVHFYWTNSQNINLGKKVISVQSCRYSDWFQLCWIWFKNIFSVFVTRSFNNRNLIILWDVSLSTTCMVLLTYGKYFIICTCFVIRIYSSY